MRGGDGGFVGLFGVVPAVVGGEFLEVGEDGKGQFHAPGVSAELVGGGAGRSGSKRWRWLRG